MIQVCYDPKIIYMHLLYSLRDTLPLQSFITQISIDRYLPFTNHQLVNLFLLIFLQSYFFLRFVSDQIDSILLKNILPDPLINHIHKKLILFM